MPELPEVETVARTLYPHVHDNLILSATLLRAKSLHALSLPLETVGGCRIRNIHRRAKLLIFDLDAPKENAPTLLIAHLRMTGRLLAAPLDTSPGKHTRCLFTLQKPDGGQQLLFYDDTRTFGQILLTRQETLSQWEFWRNLGPEPLELSEDGLHARLKGKRPIKTALLDQKVIAGLGNIYVDESLFAARILPTRPAESLSRQESAALLENIKTILREAIAKKGSSIRDYVDADGKSGNFQKSFYVYGRGNKPCKICGNSLEMLRLGGRSTVFCKHCQK